MKVILDMAITVNGIIARRDFTEDFFPEYNWNIFCNIANKIGCLIFGGTTYELIKDSANTIKIDKSAPIVDAGLDAITNVQITQNAIVD